MKTIKCNNELGIVEYYDAFKKLTSLETKIGPVTADTTMEQCLDAVVKCWDIVRDSKGISGGIVSCCVRPSDMWNDDGRKSVYTALRTH